MPDRDRIEHMKHVQEWLCLANLHVAIDGVMGPATQEALRRFQRRNMLDVTGTDDEETVIRLTNPIRNAICLRLPLKGISYSDTVAFCASQHLREHPREVGGQNKGPWVRLYMDGMEGEPWCAGFVSYLVKQAAELVKIEPPIGGSVSCAELARQAKAAGLFSGEYSSFNRCPAAGSITLAKTLANRYYHCGVVVSSAEHTFESIEGNSNDNGSAEGFEVVRKIHAYGDRYDFIVWAH